MIGLGLSITQLAVRQLLGFNPLSLFAANEPGVWYDPSDLTTMFQDAAGTTPVTAVEQPVGLLLDKSRGLVLGPEAITNEANRDFSSDTGFWTKGGSWTISGGVATNTGSVANEYLQNDTLIGAGKAYILSFDLLATSSYLGTGILCGGAIVTLTKYGISSLGRVNLLVYVNPTGSNTSTRIWCSAGQTITIDNISVRELPGNHAFQTTATSRPVLSARVNLLTKTEQFDDAAWVKNQVTITANATAAPDGTLTADLLTENSATAEHYVAQTHTKAAASLQYTYRVRFKNAVGTRNFGIALTDGTSGGYGAVFSTTGTVVTASLSIGNTTGWTMGAATVTTDAEGFYLASITVTTNTATRLDAVCYQIFGAISRVYPGDGTSGIYIWGASLVPANQSALPYQRVNTATDYDTVGFQKYLKFDGIDDSLVTPTITPGVDKAQVFAGVRKLSDAAIGAIVGLSSSPAGNIGAFEVLGPAGVGATDYRWTTRGTSTVTIAPLGFPAPITNVLSGIGNISGDLATLRLNGAQAAQDTGDQGTGNYLAYPLYIGRRGGSSLPFNGHLYPLIVRFGPTLTEAQITQTEQWVNGKTGAY